jgi:hypothetical protein
MFLVREKAIPQNVKRTLPQLLQPWDSARTTHRAYGVDIVRNEPTPATWDQFAERAVRDSREDIQRRWRDYLQAEAALDEAAQALGTEVALPSLRKNLDGLRAAILHLVELFELAGHAVELPEFDPEPKSYATEAFKLEVLREVPKDKHAREWLAPQAREELEAWEREQRDRFDD